MRTKRKNYFCVLIILLVLIEIATIFLMYKSSNNKNTLLDNVSLKEQTKNMNGLAIMLEQNAGDYKESPNKSWPTEGYTFNKRMSKCIDNLGNKTENILTYKNGLVYVETDNTSYCYIYFDIDRAATKELLATVSSDQLWKSTLENDGYRYVGTNPDNYICFGTNNQEECKSNTDKYMYRIIGIFEDSEGNQHLKLIKKEALNTAYAWNADYQTDVDWDESDLYKGINGSYFATNSEYSYMQDSGWTNKIAEWNYTATNTKTYESSGMYYNSSSVSEIYLHEMNQSTKKSEIGEWKTVNSKISLMYASDYFLSLGIIALDFTSGNYITLKTGWMYLNNNDSGAPNQREWTMSRYGFASYGSQWAWRVHSDGDVAWETVTGSISARPVFYLESDTKLDKGTGTIEEPYTIEISPNLREYCEEYNNINECIENEENNIEEVSDLWNSTLEEDGIRYVGTNPNNYICFGTTNKEECTTDTDKYMYRIIGIFEDDAGNNHLKLIKKEALNTAYTWHSSNIDINWEESDLYKGINGSYFATNSEYSYMQNGAWNNLVATWEYISTNTKTYENSGPNYYYQKIKITYLHEMNRSGKTNCYYSTSTPADCSIGVWKEVNSKIGLMYASDYLLSLGYNALSFIPDTHRVELKTGWMHLYNNDEDSSRIYEWTISLYGLENDYYRAIYVWQSGYVSNAGIMNNFYVRPVFYLTENIKITSGKGSITEPFIIS